MSTPITSSTSPAKATQAYEDTAIELFHKTLQSRTDPNTTIIGESSVSLGGWPSTYRSTVRVIHHGTAHELSIRPLIESSYRSAETPTDYCIYTGDVNNHASASFKRGDEGKEQYLAMLLKLLPLLHPVAVVLDSGFWAVRTSARILADMSIAHMYTLYPNGFVHDVASQAKNLEDGYCMDFHQYSWKDNLRVCITGKTEYGAAGAGKIVFTVQQREGKSWDQKSIVTRTFGAGNVCTAEVSAAVKSTLTAVVELILMASAAADPAK